MMGRNQPPAGEQPVREPVGRELRCGHRTTKPPLVSGTKTLYRCEECGELVKAK
jgi:hypothetical protein